MIIPASRLPGRVCRRRLAAGLPLLAALALCPAVAADPRELFAEAVDRLFAGQPRESAKLFDDLVALRPEIEPELWQRGLAQYYADRFADGQRQFERHKEVNPADVENVTWHFACVARQRGVAAARQAMLPVGSDARVPMKEVLELYRGTGSAEAVLAAAATGPDSARRNQLCYAHLYLGLLAEAEGDADGAKRHLVAAATTHRMDHFMGKIAQLHCRLRGWLPDTAEPGLR
ncbi:MAG: hypothetical protein FJ309_15065 [Planctomycetes bacterium]|nr:hypothetical protein [Planctomycetota bacterium]